MKFLFQESVFVSISKYYSAQTHQVICELCQKESDKPTEDSVEESTEEIVDTDNIVVMMFNEFCETTGLHGWKYLTKVI